MTPGPAVPGPERGHRVLELDGLRGLAILLVVFAHVAAGVYPHDRGLAPELGSLGGFVGVQLFFVLSGLLITQRLVERPGVARFYRRRVERLYPTLLVVCFVTLLWSGDVAGTVRALTYTENLRPVVTWTDGRLPGTGALGHTWSLAVEEQFYLVWPAVLILARHHAAKVAAVGIAATIVAQQVVGWSDTAVYAGLRWDAILAGCLITLVGWRGNRTLFALGAAVLVVYALGLPGPLERIDYPIATAGCVLVVGSAATVGLLSAPWLVHVGRISYAWYLWHMVVLRLDLPTPLTLVASLALAEATYVLVDRRAQAGRGVGSPDGQTAEPRVDLPAP
ncbi:MAG TPA: acyltransferase [Iamia sp.]